MATINLTQLKKDKEAKPASSFNNAPTIVLNKGKSSVETPRTNYDFSDRTAEPVQRKTLQTPVVTAPQTTTVNQQINRPAQQDQYGLWDNAGYVVEQAGKGLQGGIGGLVNAASTFLDKPLQTVNAIGNFGSKFSTSNDYSQYDPATAEALRQKDAEIEQLRRQMYSNLDENFLDPIAQKGVELGAGMIAESQESNYDRDKLSGVGRFTGDVAKAVTGMAPSIAASVIATPFAGAATASTIGLSVMGAGAYGQSLQQALNDGASYEDAVVYGLASAGVEIATEKLFGGIPFFGEGAVDDVLKEWMQAKLGTGTGKKVVEYLVDSVGEGAEEYISEVAGEFLVDIYTDERKDKDFFDRLMDVQDDAFYSFLLGAVTGGVMGAPRTILQSIKSGKTQEQSAEVQKTPTEKDPMKAMINEDAKAEAQKIVETPSETQFDSNFLENGLKSDNVAVKMEAQKLNEKKIRKLYENRTSTEKQINDIVKTMNSLSVPASVLEDYIDFDALGAASSKGIELSKKADKGITRVAVHEIKHLASTSGINNQLSQVLRSLAEMDGIDLDKSRENIVKEYAKRKKYLDNAAVEEELDAYIAQEYLFTEHGIKGLVRSNLSLAEKVMQMIRNIRIRISGTEFEKQLLKAEQLYTKAINEVSKSQSYKTDTERRNMYAGPKAKNANLTALERAKQMESENVSKDDIWKETGWIKKADGEWRFEIDDSKAKFNFDVLKNKSQYLKDVLEHRELFENYPFLNNMVVYFDPYLDDSTKGKYYRSGNDIALNPNVDITKLKGTLLHEIEHVIQEKEGFQEGTNLTEAKKDLEDRLSGKAKYESIPGFLEDYNRHENLVNEWVDLFDKLDDKNNFKRFSELDKEIKGLRKEANAKYGENAFSNYRNARYPFKIYREDVENQYFNNLGEVEARDTSERMLMTAEERRQNLPKTEGYVTKSYPSENNNTQYAIVDDIRYSITDSSGRMLTKKQQEYFKDSKVRDENGNLLVMYHGTNSDFNIFLLDKSGQSNNNATIGFWFTPNKEGAENFAREVWYGDREEPAIIESYLNIKKPKVYKTVDNSTEIDKLRERYRKLNKEAENLRESKDFVPEFVIKYGGLTGDYLENAKKIQEKHKSLISEAQKAYRQIEILGRSDAYDLFRADVLSAIGEDASRIDRMTGNDGNIIDYKKAVKLLRDELIREGYDGIIIKGTDYDRDVMGGTNDQYVAFESNQIKRVTNAEPTSSDDIRYSIGTSMLERSKDPAVRARAQMEKRIRHTFLFNNKSNPLKMYDVTTRIEDEFERTGKISDDLRNELFTTAYEETLRSSDVSYKELPEFKQMLQEDLNRAVSQYENTLIKERELKKFAEENDIDVSEVRLNPTTGFLKNVKPQDLPDKIISYKKLKASLKSDLINQVDNYAGGKVIDELIDKAAIEIVEDGFISSPTKFEIRQEMIKNGYSINAEAMNDNKELYDFIKSTKFNVPRGFGREIQDFDRTKKLLKTSTQDGQSIDKVYQELRSRFGEFFPDDLTNPADQYQQIADVMAELEPTRLMLEDSEQYNAEMRQYLEDNFTDRLEDFKNQILYRSQKDYYDRAAKKQVAYDDAMNQVSEKISEKFFKENKDIDELQKSEHVIKSASIEDLSEVIAKIQDRGALSKTLAQNLDAMANGDVMLRAKLSEIFEKPLREAKKTYVTNQKRVLNDVYKRIVTDLGIKMGSKESAAMMWYGEGQKQLNKVKGKVESDKLEFTKYTLDDLKKDFPKTWQNIVEADKIMRKYYDEYVDRINESLEKVYSESVLKESVNEKRTQLQKDIREAQERLEQLKAQRTGEVGGPDLEARINAQRKRISDLSRQFNNVAEDVYRNKRLKKRSDYYHHFQEIGFAENIQQILNVDNANNISNALAGISEYTKPKSKWEKFMQRRSNVARYEEDAIKGFLKYSPAAEYKISFDPYVAQMRGTIQDMIKLSDEANLNNAKAINWLTNYTNSLAGKTNPMDRWLAHTESGRTVLQLLNKVNSRVKANAVVGNLNSAVSQFYNLPNGLAVLTDAGGAQSALDVAKGSADYSAYAAKKISGQDISDNPINQSVFLAERYIDSTIEQFDESIMHKPEKAAKFLLTFGDQVVAEQLWFSAYEQGMRLGKHDPVAYADDLVSRSVAGRGIGEVPLMQQSQVVKLIAPFQVEVNNAYHLMKQLGAGALKDKEKLLSLAIMYGITWIMNEVNEALTGNRVGMDIFNAMQDAVTNWDTSKNPVTNTFNAAGRLTGEILSNVPMGAQFAQMVVSDEYDREKLFGESDPSRYGTGNIGVNALMDPAVQLVTGQNVDWQSLVTNFATPMGGKQLNRFYKMAEDIGLIPRVDISTEQGLQASWKPGAYNDKGQLKYQIDTSDPLNVMKGFAFGTYATNEGKNYLDNEYSALSAKKTTLYETAVEQGADPVEFYNALREANYSRNLVDKNGESIDNSKAAMNREALERNNSFDEVKKLIESGQAEASDFGLTKTVFEWTQEEFNKFMKSLDK